MKRNKNTSLLEKFFPGVKNSIWIIFAILGGISSIGYILLFGVLAIIRAKYPFELEWIEGAFLDQIHWIRNGNPVYPPPSIFYIPTSKTPLYFYISAVLVRIFGDGFLLPRLVSIFSTFGSFFLLFKIVTKDTQQPVAGLIAAGVYAASFRFTGAWMDLAKTDSLVLFLLLLAYWVGRRYSFWKGYLLSGNFFVLAYFTKQIALPVMLAFAPGSLLATRGRNWLQWLVTFGGGIIAYTWFENWTGGWFSFYTISASIYHERLQDYFFFWERFWPIMWPSLLIVLFYIGKIVLDTIRQNWRWSENAAQNLGFGVSLLLASWSIYQKIWTYDNGLMPAVLGISMLCGLGFAIFSTMSPIRIGRNSYGFVFPLVAGGLIATQFWLLWYNPLQQLPSSYDQALAETFVAKLQNLPGKVWVYQHGTFTRLAGKGTYMHSSPFGDVVGGEISELNQNLSTRRQIAYDTFNQAFTDQFFDWVIIDQPDTSWAPYYLFAANLFENSQGFFPVTGAYTRPASLMVKNPIASGGEFPIADPNLNARFLKGWEALNGIERHIISERAEFQIALEDSHNYQVSLSLHAFCSEGVPAIKSFMIGWEKETLALITSPTCEPVLLSLFLSEEAVSGELQILWFDMDILKDRVPPFVTITAIRFDQE